MKKLSAMLAMTLLSVSTFASRVPENKLPSYKDAAKFALSKVQLTCTFTPTNIKWNDGSTGTAMLNGLIAQATSAVLNDEGAQPVLTFNYDDGSFNSTS